MRTPRIPSMDQIRGEFIEAWAGDFVRGEIAAAQYFDQALNGHNLAIEAAAEQRGAIKAFRKTQEIIAGFEHTIDEARNRDDMINTGYLIQEIDTEIQDLMEDDDD